MVISFDRLLQSFNQRLQRSRRKTAKVMAADIQGLEPRALLAGAVTVVVTAGGDLKITGSSDDDEIEVTFEGAEGGVTIQSLNDTTINGQVYDAEDPFQVDVAAIDDLVIKMKGGNDKVIISVFGTSGIDGKLTVDMGSGNDVFLLGVADGEFSVGGIADVKLGSGNDDFGAFSESDDPIAFDKKLTVTGSSGNDHIGTSNVTVAGSLRLEASTGNDSIAVANTTVGRDLFLKTDGGLDQIGIANLEVNGTSRITTGTSADQVNIDTAEFHKKVTILMGSGDDDLAIADVTATKTDYNGGSGTDNLSPDEEGKNFEGDEPEADDAAAEVLLDLIRLAANTHAPEFTSSDTPSVLENTTFVVTVEAEDLDIPAQTVTFEITGGVDADKFSIDSETGDLTFDTAPNFENPTDAGVNNVYNVEVTAEDEFGLTTVQSLAVTVTPVNDLAPTFTSAATANVAENTTAVTTVTATDADLPAQTVSFSIMGGADAAKFAITSAGVLTFIAAPNFEAPTDVAGTGATAGDNIYQVIVKATDSGSPALSTTQTINVTVTPVNEVAPVFTSSATPPAVPENTSAVTTVTATDADLPAQTVTFSITGGADAAKFAITPSGALAFITPPDFENPTDAGANNVYNVDVTASDGNGLTTVQSITVTVTGVNDVNPVITSAATASVPENTSTATVVLDVNATDLDVPSQVLTYALSGPDVGDFTIDAATGEIRFVVSPDFEAPADAGGNNVYDVTVTATDNLVTFRSTSQVLTITVTSVDDNNPTITSNGGGTTASENVSENQLAVTTVVATDADLPPQGLTYTIIGGVDDNAFVLDPNTGVLTFAADFFATTNDAPDFETPLDTSANNTYVVIVQVSDGSAPVDTQTITVNVLDVPQISSASTFTVPESQQSVTTVTTSSGAAPLAFAIFGGDDADDFEINSATGALTFVAPPDFENPTDSDTNNVYQVEVQVTDANGETGTQTITVTVTDAPLITSASAFTVPEGQSTVATVTVMSGAALPLSFAITGGDDMAAFEINATTGALSFAAAPDFENPTDSDTDNIYQVEVQVTDDNGETSKQTITVTVTPIEDNSPAIDTTGITTEVPQGDLPASLGTVIATDADLNAAGAPDTLIFSIVTNPGGLFSIDAATGELTLSAAATVGNHAVTVGVSDNEAAGNATGTGGAPSVDDTAMITVSVVA